MLRALLIVINVFVVWIAGMLSSEPTADVTAPRSIKPGGEFVVEAIIHKGDAKDFLRFVQTLPAGFTASPMESDGGTFYFEQQTVKFLWSKLPEKADLKISYKVTVDPSVAGEFQITGKLSYVVDNLPKPIALTPLNITVTGTPTDNSTVNNTTTTTTTTEDSTARPPAQITATRVVPTDLIKNEFQVNITVDKGELRSFAKIQDSLPEGFTAVLVKSDGADFEYKNGIVLFRWYAVPAKSTLNVIYKVVVSPDVQGAQTIKGHFSYVEDNQGKNVDIPSSTVTVQENPALAQQKTTDNTTAQNTTTTQTNTDNTTTNTAVTDNSSSSGNKTTDNPVTQNTTNNSGNKTTDNSAAQNNSTSAGNKTTDNSAAQNTQTNTDNTTTNTAQNNTTTDNSATQATTNSSDKSGIGSTEKSTVQSANAANSAGIRFSIQIAAMSRMLPVSYFSDLFHITESIQAEQVDGLNKYITGSFSAYREARDRREALRSKGVDGAFVTAYNNNKRITVQEALMISSQTWLR